jgi:Xaa-Pro dipeptidase
MLTHERPPVLVTDYFERGRVANSCWIDTVRYYHSRAEAVSEGLEVMQELGLTTGTLGIEQRSWGLTPRDYLQFIDGLPAATIRDPSGIVEECRVCKSDEELALMRRAAVMTKAGIQAGLSAMSVGTRDYDIGAAIADAVYRSGSDVMSWGPGVAVGYRAGAPHCTFNGSQLKHGDTVFLELTGQAHRYAAPCMCTAIVGEPSGEMVRIAEAGQEAIATIRGTARPGVLASEVARAASHILKPVIDRYGLYTPDRWGYSVGIGYPPTWDEDLSFLIREDNERPLRPGMTFHLPISLRRYAHFGVNQSSTIAITETGSEALTEAPRLPVVRDT